MPSRVDLPASHQILEKSNENQRYKKKLKEMKEDEEIANGDVEIVVDNIQSHIKLILRLIKSTHLSLQEYKQDAQNLKQEVFELRQKLIEENEDVLKELNPELLNNYKALKKEVKKHKTDTELKYKDLLQLKKGNAQLQQLLDNEVETLNALQKTILGSEDQDYIE